jgi:thiamine-monophosphate kinase
MGLRLLRGLAANEDETFELVDRYRTPRPRLELGLALRGLATAAIDVSDGLVADLRHILAASRVGAVLDASRLPLSSAGHGIPGAREAALTGGDDYELLFTTPPERRAAIEALPAQLGHEITRIGSIREPQGLEVHDGQGGRIVVDRIGWRHF